jgi:excisionase family DNA binding protein
MSSPSASRRASSPTWLSLGPASRMLGVDPGTLRRWADDGRIVVYTTPGGHRRFDRAAVERLATERRPGAGRRAMRPPNRSLSSLGATPERLQRAYRRSYTGPGPTPSAVGAVGDADRSAYRHDGRRLVAALVAYLDADPLDELGRLAAETDAASLVDDLARRLAAAGTSLTESVALFVAARRPFLAELSGLGRRRALDPARLGALYDDASALLDRLLLRLIATYQETQG